MSRRKDRNRNKEPEKILLSACILLIDTRHGPCDGKPDRRVALFQEAKSVSRNVGDAITANKMGRLQIINVYPIEGPGDGVAVLFPVTTHLALALRTNATLKDGNKRRPLHHRN